MTERTGRIAAPAAVALFVVIGIFDTEQPLEIAVGAGIVTVAVCVAHALWTARGWTLAAGFALAAAGIMVICNAIPSNLGWFGLCVLVGWYALVEPTEHAIALGLGLGVAVSFQWSAINHFPGGGGTWVAGIIFTMVICILARRQRDLLDQLREAQAGLAERSRAEERNRIAGEMHDVIGHALTVSLLHVSSARLALDEDPEEAHASLAEAERLGQQSLAEVRQAVGLLREHSSTRAPMPQAAQLSDLVETFRRAGRSVELEIDGNPGTLTTTSGLAVYRIVQESLTNVVRHAAPSATAWIRLRVTAEQAQLTIEDDGGTPIRGADGPGVGIIGMRERAEAVGGRLTAGPAGLGWRVEAVLPSINLAVG